MPWILLGDYNTVLYQEEHLQGGQQMGVDTRELQNLFSDLHIMDLHYTGNYMTWCNKRDGNSRVYCKLDRVLANECWVQQVASSHVEFLTCGSSDHSASLVSISNGEIYVPRPFKFCNMWVQHQNFKEVVAQAWGKQFNGCPMYVFMRKQKEVKLALKQFHKNNFSGLPWRVQASYDAFVDVQNALAGDLFIMI